VQQAFNFGVFAQGATGGTISILPNASRAASGSVIPLNMGGLIQPANTGNRRSQGNGNILAGRANYHFNRE